LITKSRAAEKQILIKKFVAKFDVSVDPTTGCFQNDVKGNKSIRIQVTKRLTLRESVAQISWLKNKFGTRLVHGGVLGFQVLRMTWKK
jgi:hypothetical protein